MYRELVFRWPTRSVLNIRLNLRSAYRRAFMQACDVVMGGRVRSKQSDWHGHADAW